MLGPSSDSAMRSVAIENPVAYISVSTARRAPSLGRVREQWREMLEVRGRVLPHDVVLDRGDPHRVANVFNRVAASSITSSRLQHANRTRGRPAALSS